jgi:hypothetical protein
MPGLILRDPTVKPEIGTPVNWDHPLAQNLVMCLPLWEGMAGAPQDLCANRVATANGAPTWVPGFSPFPGIARNYVRGSSQYDDFGAVLDNTGQPMTLFCVTRPTALPSATERIAGKYLNTASKGYAITASNANQFAWSIGNGASQSVIGGAFSTARPIALAGTFDPVAKKGTYYEAGLLIGTSAALTTSTLTTTASWRLGVEGAVANAYSGEIYCVYQYNVILGAGLIEWLSREPFAMFMPFEILRFYSVSTTHSVAFNMTVGTSVSLSKQVNKTLPLSVGTSVSLSKQVNKTLPLSVGTSVSLLRNVVKQISGMTVGTSLTLSRVVTKTLSVTVGTSLTLARTIVKTFALSVGTALTLIASKVGTGFFAIVSKFGGATLAAKLGVGNPTSKAGGTTLASKSETADPAAKSGTGDNVGKSGGTG